MSLTTSSRIPWIAEPFRLFFPFGLLSGVLAVLLWPVWLRWPESIAYPLESHRFLMLQSYLGAFAMGFLGTAGPRLLGVPALRVAEVLPALLLVVVATVFHLVGNPIWGNLLFAAAWLGFGLLLAMRWEKREDLPPPGFPLILLTWFTGWAAPILWVLIRMEILSAELYPFWKILQDQVFPTGMILGVGAFLLPRFWGRDSLHDFPEMRKPDAAWSRECQYACWVSVLILVGAAMSANGMGAPWNLLPALVCTLYLVLRVRLFSGWKQVTPLGWLARVSLILLVLGLWLEPNASAPWKIVLLHLFFMGGISLLLLAVASRVVWGHTGQKKKLQGSHILISSMGVCIVSALVLRGMADITPEWRTSLLAISALVWVGVHLAWGLLVLPGVCRESP